MGKKTRFVFLALGLFFVLLSWKTVDLVLDYVIAPRAVIERSGWMIRFFEPVSGNNSNGFETFSKSGKIIPLHPGFRSATAYTIWTVPVTGPYQLHFSAEAVSTVAIDGKTILHSLPRSQTGRIESAWINLRRGKHLIRLDMHNANGGGTFSVAEMTPPLMWMTHLEGDMIAFPRLGSLDTWWYVMVIARPLLYCSLSLVVVGIFSFLLSFASAPTKMSVAVVVCFVVIPPMIIPSFSKREPYIGDMVHRQLQRKNPEFVFIGNSMLWSRIDDETLEQLLDHKNVHSIVNFGGMSAFLYLSFKYLLLPAQVNPKRVFFFFRDTTLTQPKIFTTGPYIEGLLQKVCPMPDPVYEHLVRGDSSSLSTVVYRWFKRLFPIQENGKILREVISQAALSMTIPGKNKGDRRIRLRKVINDRFSLDKTGTGKGKQGQPWAGGGENYDFKGMLNISFLPEIIKLARKNHVRIAFIRVQRRPPETGYIKDPPEMKSYLKELKEYLTLNHVDFYDFTDDPELPLSMYAMGDHIAEPKQYTPIFFQRVKHLLQ
jgi:hypothetical protein